VLVYDFFTVGALVQHILVVLVTILFVIIVIIIARLFFLVLIVEISHIPVILVEEVVLVF